MTLNPHWIEPQWDVPPHVRAVCTTRAGGVSPAPYDSMNLGSHVGDWGYNIMANRNALRRAIHARPVYLQQVHGCDVLDLDASASDGMTADGAVTRSASLACTVMVADCMPVLVADDAGRAVGCAHAGWRGLAAGVVEATARRVAQLAASAGADLAGLRVWLGPCIGPLAFEVGGEVRDAFVAHDAAASGAFAPHTPGKFLADLPALARMRLQTLGVTHISGNDGTDAWCTVKNPSRFFSFRRDGVTGRMAACIWLDPAAA